MDDPKVTNEGDKNYQQFVDKDELIGESSLSLSDYFHDSIPYDVKPVPSLCPMDEDETRNLFAELEAHSGLQLTPLLKETDTVEYDGEHYSWDDDGIAVFLYYPDINTWVASMYNRPRRMKTGVIYSNSKKLETDANEYLKNRENWEELSADMDGVGTHGDLEVLVDSVTSKKIGDNAVQGRLFAIGDGLQYILGFWEEAATVKAFKTPIIEFLNRIGLHPEDILWTYDDGLEVVSYDELFGKEKKKLKKRSKEQIELLRQIHLNAVLKKKVLQLPPHPFQLLADKLGVTVAQLRQIAGKAVAEEYNHQTLQEQAKTLSEIHLERGDGFWLDSKAVFHNVDQEFGASGHLDWAKRKFKRPMSYEEVLSMGYIWVALMSDTGNLNFLYHIPPSPTQMYMLKKTAVDAGIGLYDMVKKEMVDTSALNSVRETEEIRYNRQTYSFDTHGYSVMVLFQKEEDPGMIEGSRFSIGNKKIYLAAINDVKYVSNDPQVEKAANRVSATPDVDETHGNVKMAFAEAVDSLGADDYYDELLQARIFKDDAFPGGYVVGFWESRNVVKKYHDIIMDYLKRVGINNPQEVLWTAHGGTFIKSYSDFWGKKHIPKTDERKLALMRIQHLNAIAKKQLLGQPTNKLQRLADSMGITVVQLRQLLGGMDEILFEVEGAKTSDGVSINWRDAQNIFTIYRPGVWTLQFWNGRRANYICSNKKVEKILNTNQKYQHNWGDSLSNDDYLRTHYTLFKHIVDAGENLPPEDRMLDAENDVYHGFIAARVFHITQGVEKTVVGFWQDIDEVRKYWDEVQKILEMANVDFEQAKYTFNNYYSLDQEYTYKKITGKEPTKKTADKRELELMKILHLSPEAKKALIKRGDNYLQNLADDMGITVAQLRQKLGSLDESDDVQYQGERFGYWREGSSIVLIWSNGTWLSSTFKEPLELGFYSNDETLKKGIAVAYDDHGSVVDTSFDYPYNHPDLKDLMGYVHHNLSQPELEGRLFRRTKIAANKPGAYIIGFWEDKSDVVKYKKAIFEYLTHLGLKPEDVLWADSGGKNEAQTFEVYFSDTESKSSLTPEQRALMKLQHLDALAKKKLLKNMPAHKLSSLADSMGITLPQLRQMLGSMDEVETLAPSGRGKDDHVYGSYYTWTDDEAVGIVLIYPNFSVWTKSKGQHSPTKFFSDDQALAGELNSTFGRQSTRTHDRLKERLDHVTGTNKFYNHKAKVEGRIFDTVEGVYIGFWENLKQVKPYWNKVQDVLRELKYDPKTVRYTFGANGYKNYSYDDVQTGYGIKPSSAKYIELQRIIHMNDQLKKALIQLPPDRFQAAADKLGITTIELKRLLGRDIAEETVE